jgi:glycogen operon protein
MDARDVVPEGWHTRFEPGGPEPLGSTLSRRGTNFAIHSPAATRVTLALFAPGGLPRGEHALDPARHRTNGVWHVFVPRVRAAAEYGWRADSDTREPGQFFDAEALLLDPYAKGVAGAERWGERVPGGRQLRAVIVDRNDLARRWRHDRRPATPLADSVIYETHVRAFTRHPSANVKHPGTYAGFIERIPWLKSLGVTAVQLMPIAEFDETDNPRVKPGTGEPLFNAWGYMPLAFMAPKVSYAADATAAGALREFRALVAALHAAGIEVILDVVFNHTAEGGLRRTPISWRGLDRPGYFVLDDHGRDIDHTGCGHTFAATTPVARRLVLDALRFWAVDMHVDGFRFDLASALTRGARGEPLEQPPLIHDIATDPALARCKLLAEPWDMGLYHVGRFPEPGRFSELNGRARDDLRDWLRAATPDAGGLVERLGGSRGLYGDRADSRSVNFITSHDGFTLADLVSFEHKHNHENGEENRDGGNDNRSWNGGAEGATSDPAVVAVRARQARNAALMLLLARGPRLWLWGDEVLRTQRGNNNPYCQDGPEWWFNWDATAAAGSGATFTRFVRGLIALRREHASLRAAEWHHAILKRGSTLPTGRRAVLAAKRPRHAAFALLANGEAEASDLALPAPDRGKIWHLVADTAASPPADMTTVADAAPLADQWKRRLEGRSLVLLVGR